MTPGILTMGHGRRRRALDHGRGIRADVVPAGAALAGGQLDAASAQCEAAWCTGTPTKWTVLWRYTLSIASHMFQVLLFVLSDVACMRCIPYSSSDYHQKGARFHDMRQTTSGPAYPPHDRDISTGP